MRTVKINELEIGAGKPKIAVPLIEATTEALINTAKQVCQEPIDMIEWRLDFFTNIHSIEAILKTARQLRRILDNRPLLVTLRTKDEGGNYQPQIAEYTNIYQELIKSHLVDLIDIEVLQPTTVIRPLVQLAHEEQVKIIMSNHDFCKTPPATVLQARIEQMTNYGADIAKFAVMPQSREDLLTILNVTNRFTPTVEEIVFSMQIWQMGSHWLQLVWDTKEKLSGLVAKFLAPALVLVQLANPLPQVK